MRVRKECEYRRDSREGVREEKERVEKERVEKRSVEKECE